jgi:hypothetical protein
MNSILIGPRVGAFPDEAKVRSGIIEKKARSRIFLEALQTGLKTLIIMY